MEWYEYIIAIVAVGLVALPIVLAFHNKKTGKGGCAGSCGCCSMKDSCCKNFKEYIQKLKEEK